MRQQSFCEKKMTKQLTAKREDAPLHLAARAGNLGLVREIISNCGDAELNEVLMKQNHSGETALYAAAECGHVDLAKEMMKYYDVGLAGIKARNGYDAFHIASKQGHIGNSLWMFQSFFYPLSVIRLLGIPYNLVPYLNTMLKLFR